MFPIRWHIADCIETCQRHVPTLWWKFERLFILSNTNLDFWRLVFRRRREVFILLAMPPTSLERAALVMWCGWFKLQPQTTNQRDGSFGLWFMWFAWNQTCHSTNDRCEALASLKGCFLCFCFSPPVSHSSIPLRWGNLQVQMLGETEQSAI